jgi:hypothetical protein
MKIIVTPRRSLILNYFTAKEDFSETIGNFSYNFSELLNDLLNKGDWTRCEYSGYSNMPAQTKGIYTKFNSNFIHLRDENGEYMNMFTPYHKISLVLMNCIEKTNKFIEMDNVPQFVFERMEEIKVAIESLV